MPQKDKVAGTEKQARTSASPERPAQQGVPRPAAKGHAALLANQRHGTVPKVGSRIKVPYGPVGGSGRKTNLSRSS